MLWYVQLSALLHSMLAESVLDAVALGMDVPVDGPHGLAVEGPRLYCAADGGAVVVLVAAFCHRLRPKRAA
jgi:hypothetical protein